MVEQLGTGIIRVVLAAFIDRAVTVHVGGWTLTVHPEDNWNDEGSWEETLPVLEHEGLKYGVLQTTLRHAPSYVNLGFVTEEVAIIGRRLGNDNLIPVPPVAHPEITLSIGLVEPVLIGSERCGDEKVFVDGKDDLGYPVAGVIYNVEDLPEYKFGTVHLVSKKVADAALELGRFDVVTCP